MEKPNDQNEPLHIDVELELFNPEHDDHLVTVNITTLHSGIYRTNVYCATCKRMLRAVEGRASAVID